MFFAQIGDRVVYASELRGLLTLIHGLPVERVQLVAGPFTAVGASWIKDALPNATVVSNQELPQDLQNRGCFSLPGYAISSYEPPRHIIGVMGIKGGVGKTVFTLSIVAYLAWQSNVCLIDADSQAGITTMLLGAEVHTQPDVLRVQKISLTGIDTKTGKNLFLIPHRRGQPVSSQLPAEAWGGILQAEYVVCDFGAQEPAQVSLQGPIFVLTGVGIDAWESLQTFLGPVRSDSLHVVIVPLHSGTWHQKEDVSKMTQKVNSLGVPLHQIHTFPLLSLDRWRPSRDQIAFSALYDKGVNYKIGSILSSAGIV